MSTRPPVKLTRAIPIEFELPDGAVVTVDPPTISALRAAIALDPPVPPEGVEWIPESLPESLARRVRQAKLLCGLPLDQADTWIDSLDPDALSQVMVAILAHTHGYDPQANVDLQALLKKKALIAAMHSPDSTT